MYLLSLYIKRYTTITLHLHVTCDAAVTHQIRLFVELKIKWDAGFIQHAYLMSLLLILIDMLFFRRQFDCVYACIRVFYCITLYLIKGKEKMSNILPLTADSIHVLLLDV